MKALADNLWNPKDFFLLFSDLGHMHRTLQRKGLERLENIVGIWSPQNMFHVSFICLFRLQTVQKKAARTSRAPSNENPAENWLPV